LIITAEKELSVQLAKVCVEKQQSILSHLAFDKAIFIKEETK